MPIPMTFTPRNAGRGDHCERSRACRAATPLSAAPYLCPEQTLGFGEIFRAVDLAPREITYLDGDG